MAIPEERYVDITRPGETSGGANSGEVRDLKRRLDQHIGAGGQAHAVATETAAGFMSSDDKQKLNGVQNEATKNMPDGYLLARGNQTGVQAIETINGLREELNELGGAELEELADRAEDAADRAEQAMFEVVRSQDVERIRISNDPFEEAPPGTILFYLPLPTEVFTNFSGSPIGGPPPGWTPQWSGARTWEVVEDTTASGGKSLRCGNAAGTSGIGWDILMRILDGGSDGELLWKWRTNLVTLPARALMMGAAGSQVSNGYHGGVRNQSLVSMGKFLNGEHILPMGTQVTAPTPLTLDWHITRFRKQGSDFMAKTWSTEDTEPSEWQVTATDSSITWSDWWGLLSHTTAPCVHYYDWVGFAAGSGRAPGGER